MKPWMWIAVAVLSGITPHTAIAQTAATMQVSINNEDGGPARGAQLYIFSNDRKQLVGAQEISGTMTLDLPLGHYCLYAARTSQLHGYFDRYVSPEACIGIGTVDYASVILTLHHIQQPVTYLSDATRKKLDIPQTLALLLN